MANDLFASCTLQALLNHAEAQDESHWWQVGIEYCPLAQWGTSMADAIIWIMHDPSDRSYAWCYEHAPWDGAPEEPLTRLKEELIKFARAFDYYFLGTKLNTIGRDQYLQWLTTYIEDNSHAHTT